MADRCVRRLLDGVEQSLYEALIYHGDVDRVSYLASVNHINKSSKTQSTVDAISHNAADGLRRPNLKSNDKFF